MASTSFQGSSFGRSLFEAGTPKNRQRAVSDPYTPAFSKVTSSPSVVFQTPGNGSFTREPIAASSPLGRSLKSQKISPSQGYSLRSSASHSSLRSSIREDSKTSLAPRKEATSTHRQPVTPRRTDSQEVPTGYWEHPSLKYIRPINKYVVTQRFLINLCTLLATQLLKEYILRALNWVSGENKRVDQVAQWAITGFLILTSFNIFVAFIQMIRPEDKYEDLPLTPSQRALLGLPESPSSAGKVSPTPPKYHKSSPGSVSTLGNVKPNKPSPLSKIQSGPQPIQRIIGTSPGSSPWKSVNDTSNTSSFSISSPTYKYSKNAVQKIEPADTTSALPVGTHSSSFSPSSKYLYRATESPKRRV